jgi:hypothetical protein
MTLKVIGAGLGRTGTLSLKLALEHVGLGGCYHMSEMLAHLREHLPLWIDAAKGNPAWDVIFSGYQSSCDYPGCSYWREIAAHFPDAKVVLTVRDPDSWFESVSATIFSEEHRAQFEGNPAMEEFFALTVFRDVEPLLGDRARMVDFFNRWNQSVIDEVPSERLLVYRAGDGWGPLCDFLGVPVPPEPYPRVNSREEMIANTDRIEEQERKGPPPPEMFETMVRGYLDELRLKAFPAAA